jgi:hypothetical protein
MPRKSRCCVGEGIRGMKPYIPSPPSRMPSVEDDAYLGIGTRAGMTAQYHTGSPALMEGAGILDIFKKVGKDVGKTFSIAGVNPFTTGFDLGEKVIAPALMKVIPPRSSGRGYGGACGVRHMTSGSGLVIGGQRGIRPMGSGLTAGNGLGP